MVKWFAVTQIMTSQNFLVLAMQGITLKFFYERGTN